MQAFSRFSKNLLSAFAMVVALCNSAAAADIFLGNLTNSTRFYGSMLAPNTTVNDVFYFDLLSPSTFSSVASEIVMPGFFNISGFSMELGVPAGPAQLFNPVGGVISTGNLALSQAPHYSLTVKGNVDGIFGGVYSILLTAVANQNSGPNAVVASIPEPSQWLMLLFGAGMLAGFRRRARG